MSGSHIAKPCPQGPRAQHDSSVRCCRRQAWPRRRPVKKLSAHAQAQIEHLAALGTVPLRAPPSKKIIPRVQHPSVQTSSDTNIVADSFQSLIPRSAPVKIDCLPNKGRGLIATRHIQVGEEVISEEPTAWALFPEHRSGHCANCAQPSSVDVLLSPCNRCRSGFHVCSSCETHPCCAEIAEALAKGHEVPGSQAVMTLQAALVAAQGGKINQLIESLCWHRCPKCPDLHVFEEQFTRKFGHGLAGCFVRSMCNQFTMRSTNGQGIGQALFLLSSMANHDCNPNVTVKFASTNPKRIILVARRAIEADEEICGAYIEVKLPRSERRRLISVWGFECICSRCVRALEAAGDERHLFGVRYIACQNVFAEAEGESCGCGEDNEVIRKSKLEEAFRQRQKAHTLMQEVALFDRQGIGRDPRCGSSKFNVALQIGTATSLLEECLDVFKHTLSDLHAEISWTINLLSECYRRCGRIPECNALREQLQRFVRERNACMSGDLVEAASGQGKLCRA